MKNEAAADIIDQLNAQRALLLQQLAELVEKPEPAPNQRPVRQTVRMVAPRPLLPHGFVPGAVLSPVRVSAD